MEEITERLTEAQIAAATDFSDVGWGDALSNRKWELEADFSKRYEFIAQLLVEGLDAPSAKESQALINAAARKLRALRAEFKQYQGLNAPDKLLEY